MLPSPFPWPSNGVHACNVITHHPLKSSARSDGDRHDTGACRGNCLAKYRRGFSPTRTENVRAALRPTACSNSSLLSSSSSRALAVPFLPVRGRRPHLGCDHRRFRSNGFSRLRETVIFHVPFLIYPLVWLTRGPRWMLTFTRQQRDLRHRCLRCWSGADARPWKASGTDQNAREGSYLDQL